MTHFASQLSKASVLLASAAMLLGLAGCNKSETSATSPSPAKCQLSLGVPQSAIASTGGTGVVSVTAGAECAWTAASQVSWITGVSPSSGQGSGEVRFQVAPNAASTPRQGDLVLNGLRASISQSGSSCTFVISSGGQTVTSAGASGSISVSAASDCPWTATSTVPWLTITAGASGVGDGVVQFTADPNTGAARTGTIDVAGQIHTVTQAAFGCSYSINPGSQSTTAAGGPATPVAVTAGAGCTWTATTNDTWITITSGATGSGNGTVQLTVASNSGAARTGSVQIAGVAHTVTQSGVPGPTCAYTISPTTLALDGTKHTGVQVAVTAGTGCAWTAASNDSWITVTLGATGSGSGTVEFTVEKYTGNQPRTGSLTIAGQTLTVTQTK